MTKLHIEEQIIARYHSHPVKYLNFYILGIILLVVGFFTIWQLSVMGVLIFIFGEVLRQATTFYVLDNGIARGYNFFSTSRTYTEYSKIQDVAVSQSFIETLFGIGSIDFDTAGTDGVEIEFFAIPNPYGVEKIVRDKMKII